MIINNENNFQCVMAGGLSIQIHPHIKSSIFKYEELHDALHDVMHQEAKAHGVTFNTEGLNSVIHSISNGDLEVLFYSAAWDMHNPQIVGATLNFRSVFFQRNGNTINVHHGLYSEDICLLPRKLRDLIRERPLTKKLPCEGLGIHFVRASIDYYSQQGFIDGVIPIGEIFEFAPSNSKIVAIQKKMGTKLGSNEDSALLKITSERQANNRYNLPVDLYLVPLINGSIDPNNFVVSWISTDNQQKIMASFTKGISTLRGTPVIQGQFISNGDVPNDRITRSVISSILDFAKHEISKRFWANDIMPKTDIESTSSRVDTVIPIHIHVFKEPEIIKALKFLGAEQRMLGDTPMQTAALDLRKAAKRHDGSCKPLELIEINQIKVASYYA